MSDELTSEPPFIVLRAARGVPFGWMPADLEGRWYNRADLIPATPGERLLAGPLARRTPDGPSGWAVCIPTSRVEHRDYDGASAQVYEVHPPDGNYANDGDETDLAAGKDGKE